MVHSGYGTAYAISRIHGPDFAALASAESFKTSAATPIH
jgi:hypothetical protein